MIMKKFKITYILFFAIIATFLNSCGVTPCKCADAALNNDTKTIKKCEEKVSKMTKEESVKWAKAEAECVQTK